MNHLPTIKIHDKEYVMVKDRVMAFRDKYPEGFIRTELVKDVAGACLFKAEVGFNNVVFSTGYSKEIEGSSNINKTSYVENCETSAVGRALAFFGIGIIESISSAEEVVGAISAKPVPPIPEEGKEMDTLGRMRKMIGELFGTDNLNEIDGKILAFASFKGKDGVDKFPGSIGGLMNNEKWAFTTLKKIQKEYDSVSEPKASEEVPF